MKFFEFASCCGPHGRSAVITTAVKPAEARLVPLYAASVPANSRRRQVRRLASRSGYSGDWRSALHAISEEIAVVERESCAGGSDTIRKKRKVSQSKVRNYGNDDHSRRAPFGGGAMVPAFSPTPFFF